MKRQTVILAFSLPRLSDKTAAQLVDCLHQLVAGIEHRYAEQIHQHHKRQRPFSRSRPTQPAHPTDPPF